MTQLGYEKYLEKKGAYRSLLTWQGVVVVPGENVSDFLESLYIKNLEAAIVNIERKEKQREVARKRNAEQASLQAAAPASSSAQADASSASVPGPKTPPMPSPVTPPKAAPSRSAQADASRSSSWSWNRDHYGSRREWSKWQGAWYYRDDARSRWIYWGR